MRWIVLALAATLFLPTEAWAQDKSVTIAARVCPSYEASAANRARNDLQESLKDLGPDTPDAVPGGRWERRQVRCGGRVLPAFGDPLQVVVPEGYGETCVYVNEFVPAGVIRVRKTTIGGTGTTAFTIRPVDARPPRVYEQRAVNSRANVPVTAGGDSTANVPIGLYDIQETATSGDAGWTLESVLCNGVPVGSAQGRIRIRLTADAPEQTCTFTNRRSSTTQPGAPGPGDGRQPGTSVVDPATNLRVTKRVRPTAIVSGQAARYTVTVSNTSGVIARDVVAEELQPPSHRVVAVEAPRGSGAADRGGRARPGGVGDRAAGRGVAGPAHRGDPVRAADHAGVVRVRGRRARPAAAARRGPPL